MHHVESGLHACLETLLGVEVMLRVDAAFPVQPQLARARRIEIVLDLESQAAGEILGTSPDEKMMIRVVHDCLGDK